MELIDGELICSKCDGEGFIDDGFVCEKCFGEGKVDWISNVMGIPKPKISTLQKLNIRRIVQYINKVIEKYSEKENNFDLSIATSKTVLENLVINKAIYDYKIISTHNHKHFEIFLKPMRTTEIINLKYHME